MENYSETTMEEIADFFKVFADATRMKILTILLEDKELCVNCITSRLEVSQSAISHQLRLLKSSGLVKSRREGKNAYYSLDDEHIETILEIAYEHAEHKR